MGINDINFTSANFKKEKAIKLNQTQNKSKELKNDSVEFKNKPDGSKDNKFTFKEAGKNFLKGIISPIKAIIQHPVMAIGMIAATVAVCSIIPIATPLLTIGFGALSLFEIGKGTAKAISEYKKGNLDNSEKAFEKIGTGVIGTALTMLGIKSSAAIAAESKAVQKTGSILDTATKTTITEGIKNKGLFNSIKEHFSLFTKDGFKATVNEFKPSTIKARKKLRQDIKKQNAKKAAENELTKAEKFAKTPEGIRRSKLKTSELEPKIQENFAKACDELNIPKELRPKLIIEDELRFLTPKEIEAKVTKFINDNHNRYSFSEYKEIVKEPIKIFDKADDPLKMSDKELTSKINNAVQKYSKENNLDIVLDDSKLRLLLNKQDGTKAGSYESSKHIMKYYPNSYRKGYRSIEETLGHEALHCKEAIQRSRLSEIQRAKIVEESLINRVLKGEPEEILLKGSFLGADMMKPPKMSNSMKNDFIKFAKENLYKNDKELSNNLSRFIDLNKQKTRVNKGDSYKSEFSFDDITKLKELEGKLAPFINKVKDLIKKNPEFIEQNSGNIDEATQALLEYSLSHNVRFNHFSKIEIKAVNDIKLKPLNKLEEQKAIQSLKDNIETLEGNARISGFNAIFGASESQYNQYQFSAEEVLARNTGANFEKRALLKEQNNLKETNKLTAQKEAEITTRIKEIDTQIEFNNTGKKYYDAYTKKINNPNDEKILKEFKELEVEFNKINNKTEPIKEDQLQYIPAKKFIPRNAFPRFNDNE